MCLLLRAHPMAYPISTSTQTWVQSYPLNPCAPYLPPLAPQTWLFSLILNPCAPTPPAPCTTDLAAQPHPDRHPEPPPRQQARPVPHDLHRPLRAGAVAGRCHQVQPECECWIRVTCIERDMLTNNGAGHTSHQVEFECERWVMEL